MLNVSEVAALFAEHRDGLTTLDELQGLLTSALRAQADAQPVAWLYQHDGCMEPGIVTSVRWPSCKEPWTEIPLRRNSTIMLSTSPAPEAAQAGLDSELWAAAQRMVEAFAPHADKCRPCTMEWQNLKAILTRASAATVAEPSKCDGTAATCPNECSSPCSQQAEPAKAGQRCVNCGLTLGQQTSWCNCEANRAVEAQQAEPVGIDPVELTEELYRAHVLKVLADVDAIARDRTDAHWAGFQNAIEEVRTRLDMPAQQAEPVGDERAAYHVEHRTNMCSEVVDANGNVFAECSWSTEAAKRAQRVCDALNAAQSGQRAGVAETTAARDVLAERERQVSAEGWTPEHDDRHDDYEMALAAIVYAESAVGYHPTCPDTWPWSSKWFKPSTPRRDLVKAGALILAEIERLDRAAAPTPAAQGDQS